jgi:hypothetical protein
MVNENDLSSTVEQSNLCINNGMEDTKDYVIHLEEGSRFLSNHNNLASGQKQI